MRLQGISMGETGELLLSNLISLYNRSHESYKSHYSGFNMYLGLMVIAVIGTPIISLFLWLLGVDLHIKAAIEAFLYYCIFGAGYYWVLMKSRKKLNELKAQLEHGGFRICQNSEGQYNENVVIVGANKIKKSYTIVDLFHNIDFEKYNKLFKI